MADKRVVHLEVPAAKSGPYDWEHACGKPWDFEDSRIDLTYSDRVTCERCKASPAYIEGRALLASAHLPDSTHAPNADAYASAVEGLVKAIRALLSAMDDWHHWPDSVSAEPLWKRYHEARAALDVVERARKGEREEEACAKCEHAAEMHRFSKCIMPGCRCGDYLRPNQGERNEQAR